MVSFAAPTPEVKADSTGRRNTSITEVGAAPSIGTVADSFDNALAESVNALYKTELHRNPAILTANGQPADPGHTRNRCCTRRQPIRTRPARRNVTIPLFAQAAAPREATARRTRRPHTTRSRDRVS